MVFNVLSQRAFYCSLGTAKSDFNYIKVFNFILTNLEKRTGTLHLIYLIILHYMFWKGSEIVSNCNLRFKKIKKKKNPTILIRFYFCQRYPAETKPMRNLKFWREAFQSFKASYRNFFSGTTALVISDFFKQRNKPGSTPFDLRGCSPEVILVQSSH